MPGNLSLYRSIFDAELARNGPAFDAMAASGDGRTYYDAQYFLESTLSMFEACGDVKYLERVIAWCLKMVSAAKIIDINGNLNWGKIWLSPYSPTKIAYQLDDFQGSTALSHLARIIVTSPALKTEYGAEAMVVYNFVRDHIVNKHLFKRKGLSGLRAFFAKTESAANDKPTLLVSILIDLVQASTALGDADNKAFNYPAILKDLASGLKDHFGTKARFTDYKGGLIWDLNLPFEEPFVGVDTMHGNRMPAALIDLCRTGNTFDKTYLTGIANLLTKVIWNGNLTSPMFTNGINGGNAPFRNRPAWNNGMIYSGWAKLSEFDAKTFEVCDAVLKACLAGVVNPSLSYNNTKEGRIALAGFLAKAAATAVTPQPPSPPLNMITMSVTSNRISLKWDAVIGATGYRLKRASAAGGPYVQIAPDLLPTSFDDNTVSPATTYYYVVSAFNAAGESANSNQTTATTTAVIPATCVTVTGANVWLNKPFPEQTSIFTAEFDVIPSIGTVDFVVGLSNGNATGYPAHAVAVRLRSSGIIDARNGAVYGATIPIKYIAGGTYHFRLIVNIPLHTYSIYVKPNGGTEILVGSNFAFRTEQVAVSKLNTWSGVVATVGAVQVCNFKPATAPVIARVLTVNSLNPESGVTIVVSPPDTTNSQDGPTSFTRTYNDSTNVALTAPATAGGNNFDKWQKDGVDFGNTLGATVTLDAAHTMTAVYVTPEIPVDPPEVPVLNFHIETDKLVLDWDDPQFVLQESPDGADGSWLNYASGTASPIIVNLPIVGTKFFRLHWTQDSIATPA